MNENDINNNDNLQDNQSNVNEQNNEPQNTVQQSNEQPNYNQQYNYQQGYNQQGYYQQGNNQQYNQYGYGFANNQSYDIKGSIRRTDAEVYVKWAKIYSILIIIQGALSCLTIIGAIVGVPYILAGVRYHKSAQSLERSLLIGDESSVTASFYELSRGVRIMGILLLIGMILMILYFVFITVLLIAGVSILPELIKSQPFNSSYM